MIINNNLTNNNLNIDKLTQEEKIKLLADLSSLGAYTKNNITIGTEDLVDGESPLPAGHIHIVI